MTAVLRDSRLKYGSEHIPLFVNRRQDQPPRNADVHVNIFGQLQTGFGSLRDGIGCADGIETSSVAIIADPGNDWHIIAKGPGGYDDLVNLGWSIHGHNHGPGLLDPAKPKHLHLPSVAIEDAKPILASGSHGSGVCIQGDEGHAVFMEQFTHQASDPTKTDDDNGVLARHGCRKFIRHRRLFFQMALRSFGPPGP